MGLFGTNKPADANRSGHSNGNVRDTRAEHNHSSDASVSPNGHAVHDLKPTDYEGRHRF